MFKLLLSGISRNLRQTGSFKIASDITNRHIKPDTAYIFYLKLLTTLHRVVEVKFQFSKKRKVR